jgi:hypothetical protein
VSWYVIRCGTDWPLKLLVRILIEITDWCSARLGVLASLKFEAFNALQCRLVLPKKGKRLWDPSHVKGNIFVKSNILSKALNGKRTCRKNKLFDNNVRRCYMRARSELAPISPPIRMDGALMISLFHPYVYQAG